MEGNLKPREIVKGLLEGTTPPRPLFLPIVFSHAARVENLPLREFRKNPTKISNALRQVRGYLRADGVTCCYDPFLEVEALGAMLEWKAEGNVPSIRWPAGTSGSELSDASPALDVSGKSNPVAIAVEVIRRLKATLRDDCLLMAGVSGPLTLGALLGRIELSEKMRYEDIPATSVDFAAAVMAGIAKAFVDAGANVVLIREDFLPPLSAENLGEWIAKLAPTINLVRFYQALPVLLLTDDRSVAANGEMIAQQSWECVVCPVLYDFVAAGPPGPGNSRQLEAFKGLNRAQFGLAMRQKWFEFEGFGDTEIDGLNRLISQSQPAVVTTAGDVPAAANMERLRKVGENVVR